MMTKCRKGTEAPEGLSLGRVEFKYKKTWCSGARGPARGGCCQSDGVSVFILPVGSKGVIPDFHGLRRQFGTWG